MKFRSFLLTTDFELENVLLLMEFELPPIKSFSLTPGMQAVVRQHLKADLLGVSGNWRNLQSFGNTYANGFVIATAFYSLFIVLGIVSAGENPCKGRECPSLYAPYFGIEGDILVLV